MRSSAVTLFCCASCLAYAQTSITNSPAISLPSTGNITITGNTTSAPIAPMASTLESQAAWQEVSGKISDSYKAAGNGKKTRDELAFEKLKRADTLAQASLQAKDFYTRYP